MKANKSAVWVLVWIKRLEIGEANVKVYTFISGSETKLEGMAADGNHAYIGKGCIMSNFVLMNFINTRKLFCGKSIIICRPGSIWGTFEEKGRGCLPYNPKKRTVANATGQLAYVRRPRNVQSVRTTRRRVAGGEFKECRCAGSENFMYTFLKLHRHGIHLKRRRCIEAGMFIRVFLFYRCEVAGRRAVSGNFRR